MIYNHCVVGIGQESLLGIEQAKQQNKQQANDVRTSRQLNGRQLDSTVSSRWGSTKVTRAEADGGSPEPVTLEFPARSCQQKSSEHRRASTFSSHSVTSFRRCSPSGCFPLHNVEKHYFQGFLLFFFSGLPPCSLGSPGRHFERSFLRSELGRERQNHIQGQAISELKQHLTFYQGNAHYSCHLPSVQQLNPFYTRSGTRKDAHSNHSCPESTGSFVRDVRAGKELVH